MLEHPGPPSNCVAAVFAFLRASKRKFRIIFEWFFFGGGEAKDEGKKKLGRWGRKAYNKKRVCLPGSSEIYIPSTDSSLANTGVGNEFQSCACSCMVNHSNIPATALLDLIPLMAAAATAGIITIRQGESTAEQGETEEKLEDKTIDGR